MVFWATIFRSLHRQHSMTVCNLLYAQNLREVAPARAALRLSSRASVHSMSSLADPPPRECSPAAGPTNLKAKSSITAGNPGDTIALSRRQRLPTNAAWPRLCKADRRPRSASTCLARVLSLHFDPQDCMMCNPLNQLITAGFVDFLGACCLQASSSLPLPAARQSCKDLSIIEACRCSQVWTPRERATASTTCTEQASSCR